jgi:hypothetical protein
VGARRSFLMGTAVGAVGLAGSAIFHPDDAAAATGDGVTDWINAVTQYGADPSGADDSTAALQSALNAAPAGSVVYLPTGTYTTSTTLVVPTNVMLLGSGGAWAIPVDNYGEGGLPVTGSMVVPSASFSGVAVMQLATPAVGEQGGGQQIRSIAIDASKMTAGNSVHGIQAAGYVGAVKLRDVLVYGGRSGTTRLLGGNGLDIRNDGTIGHNPDGWDIAHCKFTSCAGWGASLVTLADSRFDNTDFTGNVLGGLTITNSSNTKLVNCGAENNTGGPGFAWTSVSGSDVVMFDNCETQLNNQDGWLFTGSNSGWVITLSNCRSIQDGQTGESVYAGLRVSGCRSLVLATQFVVLANSAGPYYGVREESGSYGIVLTASRLAGVEAATSDDDSNTHALTSQLPISI